MSQNITQITIQTSFTLASLYYFNFQQHIIALFQMASSNDWDCLFTQPTLCYSYQNSSLLALIIIQEMNQTKEKSMRCPFDPSHIMPYDRFLNHLDKCKFPDKHNYTKCRFNPYHVFHKQSIASHQTKCPDRAKYDPIQDDQDDWFAPQEHQKPEKSTVSTAITAQSTKSPYQTKNPKFQQPQFQKSIKKRNVIVEDFDSKDFSWGHK